MWIPTKTIPLLRPRSHKFRSRLMRPGAFSSPQRVLAVPAALGWKARTDRPLVESRSFDQGEDASARLQTHLVERVAGRRREQQALFLKCDCDQSNCPIA